MASLDFRQTSLWQNVFVKSRHDAPADEQAFFREQLLRMREKVGHLVSQISRDMPGMTVHDLSHLDSLWETASIVAEGSMTVSPPEGFVLGAGILLHDSGMTMAAYPRGLEEIQETVEWKDAIARWELSNKRLKKGKHDTKTLPPEASKQVLPDVLRRLHAQQSAILAEQCWLNHNGEQQYLIDDNDVRHFYGKTIGEIAHSHWWSVSKVGEALSENLGAFPQKTRNIVDKVKIACLLRIADALHLDQSRAPRFLRTLTQPEGQAVPHWSFQEKLARPHIESDSIVFTSGDPFSKDDAEAWWLAFDMLTSVNRELADVDLLLEARGKGGLNARRVKGISSPETLSRTLQTRGWRPVDARIKVSDVPRIVTSLGGSKLYGDDPYVPLRELIQNAADAVQARRRLQNRSQDWGEIRVYIKRQKDESWLVVEDTGIGMSELVLTGPLLDFGTSFWQSTMAMEEFPGLIASGMEAIGRFGIGFFSVFMLGDVVRVVSRRYDMGVDSARALEIRGGPAGRPILWSVAASESPIDGGTRVEVLLKADPAKKDGLLCGDGAKPIQLSQVAAGIAPSLNVALASGDDGESQIVVRAGDWKSISDDDLLNRLSFSRDTRRNSRSTAARLRLLTDASGGFYGRAAISPSVSLQSTRGWVTVSGLRANTLDNIEGLLAGDPLTAARDIAVPIVPPEVLARWATEQGRLLISERCDEEIKARAAEVILQCNGEIGDLPIVSWGGEWLSTVSFLQRIAAEDEVVVTFSGDFTYDEDLDEMHPREFRTHFELDSRIVVVPSHDGRMIKERGINWPPGESGRTFYQSRLEDYVRKLFEKAWPTGILEEEDERIVGTAIYEVERQVVVFRKDE